MMEIKHQVLETNGIRMHIAEQGHGPLVILCHGFPECWYSWRHQFSALAEAGYHVVAPDQRGYGGSDRPEPIAAYHIMELVSDIVGLVHTLGADKAIIVGHDWGALVAWHCALMRADLFPGLALLSVPYTPRTWDDMLPTQMMELMAGEQQFYQLYVQQPGIAEAELEEDIQTTLSKFLYSASGGIPSEHRWRYLFDRSETLLDSATLPPTLPRWLTKADLEYFTQAFEKTGFGGGLNWYRNLDANWELTQFLRGAKIQQPSLFIAGEEDAVITMYQSAFDSMEASMPHLKQKVLLPGIGHWVQQECPTKVNQLLIEFLGTVV